MVKPIINCITFKFNSLPNNKFLDCPKLKAFADNNIIVAKMMIYVSGMVENIVRKGDKRTMMVLYLSPEYKVLFFPAYFCLSPLQKHVGKVVGGFGKKRCVCTGVRKPGNTYASPTAMI